jgi:hypothetical protein
MAVVKQVSDARCALTLRAALVSLLRDSYEWIHALSPAADNVLRVPGRQREVVHPGGCGQKAIDWGKPKRGVESAPFHGDEPIHREDAAAVLSFEAHSPLIKDSRRSRVAAPQELDAAPYLADD